MDDDRLKDYILKEVARKLALEFLVLDEYSNEESKRKAFRSAQLKYHPDKGGSSDEFQRFGAAKKYLDEEGWNKVPDTGDLWDWEMYPEVQEAVSSELETTLGRWSEDAEDGEDGEGSRHFETNIEKLKREYLEEAVIKKILDDESWPNIDAWEDSQSEDGGRIFNLIQEELGERGSLGIGPEGTSNMKQRKISARIIDGLYFDKYKQIVDRILSFNRQEFVLPGQTEVWSVIEEMRNLAGDIGVGFNIWMRAVDGARGREHTRFGIDVLRRWNFRDVILTQFWEKLKRIRSENEEGWRLFRCFTGPPEQVASAQTKQIMRDNIDIIIKYLHGIESVFSTMGSGSQTLSFELEPLAEGVIIPDRACMKRRTKKRKKIKRNPSKRSKRKKISKRSKRKKTSKSHHPRR